MINLENLLEPYVTWFCVAIILFILELILPGLIVFFFGLGALVVAVISLFIDISLNFQLAIFAVATVTSFLTLRNRLKKIFRGQISGGGRQTENLKEFIGQQAVVRVAISQVTGGRVEINGCEWKAISSQDIEEGQEVEIIGRDNITLKVKPLENK